MCYMTRQLFPSLSLLPLSASPRMCSDLYRERKEAAGALSLEYSSYILDFWQAKASRTAFTS